MSTYLVTGAAGFIASKVCEQLLEAGHTVVGVDNLNDYYDVRLKYYRLARLAELGGCKADEVARIKKCVTEVPGNKWQVSRSETSKPEIGSVPGGPASLRAGLGESKMERGRPRPRNDRGEVAAAPATSGLHLPPPGGHPSQSASGHTSGMPSSPLGSVRSQVSLKSDRFEFHALDIEDLPALDAIFSAHKFDAVFNLAARAGVRASLENPEVYRTTNVVGEENVLKCQVKHGVRKHVLASSSSVYAGCPMPFREDAVLGEPQSPYAGTKRAAEELARAYHEKHALDVTVLRYFTVFGPAGRPDMAPYRFVHWVATGQPITLFGDGTATRDFTYVDDIARGTVMAGKCRAASPNAAGLETKPIDHAQDRRGSETPPYMQAMITGKPQTGSTPGGPASLRAGDDESEMERGQPVHHSQAKEEPRPRDDRDEVAAVPGFDPKPQIPDARPELRTPGFEVINLGGGNRPITINAMIALIERELNEQSKQKPETGNLKPESSDSNFDKKTQVSGLLQPPRSGHPSLSASGHGSAMPSPPAGSDRSQVSPFQAQISHQPANPLDMTDTQADIGKAKALLGWEPQVTPEQGFQRTVEWYLANRNWLKDIKL